MGQTKFKSLNRSGYSIYWDSSWESKNNYKKKFINYFFLDLFLEKIFNDSLFVQDYFFIKNKQTLNKKNYFYKNIIFLKKLHNFKNTFKKLKIFNSKIWIFNYQDWVVVNVYTYIAKSNNISINTIKKKKLLINPKNILIFQINLIFYNIFFEGWKIF